MLLITDESVKCFFGQQVQYIPKLQILDSRDTHIFQSFLPNILLMGLTVKLILV